MKSAGKSWFVYLLKCSNGCLYTGITTDVPRRIRIHNEGKGSAYVRAHRPAKLVAFTESESRSSASRLEYSVKALPRLRKIALAKQWNSLRRQKKASP
ncbi:MAG: GIY-YIG nuclease family protein [Terrimicrobiaceae bacterium]